MHAISGKLNGHLLPIVPVGVRTEDNTVQDIDLLLDTGFNGDICLQAALLDHYCLATQPDRKLFTLQAALTTYSSLSPDAPYKSEVLWKGYPRQASVRLMQGGSFCGMLGTDLLLYHRVTIDVVEGGMVSVEESYGTFARRRSRWSLRGRKRPGPSMENFGEYQKWLDLKVPWINLPVQGRDGSWHTAWVNVDTGNNGYLTLPASWTTILGITATAESTEETSNGIESVGLGTANIKWEGKERTVGCRLKEGTPPLIGMKLLEGSRITMDFSDPRPEVEIGGIPRSARIKKGHFDSVAGLFRL